MACCRFDQTTLEVADVLGFVKLPAAVLSWFFLGFLSMRALTVISFKASLTFA